MSETGFIQHFREVPTRFARDCRLLVAARSDEHIVGYWGGRNTSDDRPNILAFNSAILHRENDDSQWIAVVGTRHEATTATGTCPVEGGQPLASISAPSYPHPDEEWDIIGPAGYAEWFSTAAPESREAVIRAVQEYDKFYRANYPYSATDREVFAVVGGWGLYIYEDEWADHPGAQHIAFTLADAEPYYAVRRGVDGDLILKTIIT